MNLFIGVVGGYRQEIKTKEEKMTALMEEWVREREIVRGGGRDVQKE